MNLEDKKELIKRKFLKDVAGGKFIYTAEGIYGEMPGCDAYIDEEIRDEGGSWYLKPYGQSFLFKGRVRKWAVEGMEMSKFLFSSFLKRLVGKSFLYSSAVLLRLFFQRKKFIYDLDYVLSEIEWRVIRHYGYPLEEYTPPVKELRRALNLALEKVFGFSLSKPYYPVDDPKFRRDKVIPELDDIAYKPLELGYMLARLVKFLCFFLDNDTAYRFRIQDVFKDKIKDIFKVLELLISRETSMGIAPKWKFIKLLLKLGLFCMPKVRKFINVFLEELNNSKIALDKDDWYYCLAYKSYNFGGLPKKERLALRRKLDEEKQNVFLIGWPEYE